MHLRPGQRTRKKQEQDALTYPPDPRHAGVHSLVTLLGRLDAFVFVAVLVGAGVALQPVH